MSRRGGWSAHVVAPSARRSVTPLRRTPVSKSLLCAYPRVLPRLRRIIVSSTRFTASIHRGSSTAGDSGVMPATLDVEELVAMQLAYVRSLAVDVVGAGEHVQDVMVTVPAFFSQFECDAIADAIELAGLHLLVLVNDGTTVVVNYTMMCQFPEPERHIVYDAGAASTHATVITFTGQRKKQDMRLRLAHSHLRAHSSGKSPKILTALNMLIAT